LKQHAGISEKPPYSLSFYDRLLDEPAMAEQQEKATRLAVSLDKKSLEESEPKVKKTEKMARFARTIGRRNLMNVLRRDDIEKLMGSYEGPCVSVFMPTHRGVTESRQDQIRFKNLLREADESLVDDGVTGTPEGLSAEGLHEQAWSIAEPLFQEAERDAVEKSKRFAGTGITSSALKKIVSASYHGGVDLLFVAVGVQHWGSFDAKNNDMIHLHDKEQPGDVDLLDFAAIQTFLQGGFSLCYRSGQDS